MSVDDLKTMYGEALEQSQKDVRRLLDASLDFQLTILKLCEFVIKQQDIIDQLQAKLNGRNEQ